MENSQNIERTSEAIKAFFADKDRRLLLNRRGIEKAAGLSNRRLTTLENHPLSQLTAEEIDALIRVLEKLQFTAAIPPRSEN